MTIIHEPFCVRAGGTAAICSGEVERAEQSMHSAQKLLHETTARQEEQEGNIAKSQADTEALRYWMQTRMFTKTLMLLLVRLRRVICLTMRFFKYLSIIRSLGHSAAPIQAFPHDSGIDLFSPSFIG